MRNNLLVKPKRWTNFQENFITDLEFEIVHSRLQLLIDYFDHNKIVLYNFFLWLYSNKQDKKLIQITIYEIFHTIGLKNYKKSYCIHDRNYNLQAFEVVFYVFPFPIKCSFEGSLQTHSHLERLHHKSIFYNSRKDISRASENLQYRSMIINFRIFFSGSNGFSF